MGSRGREMEGEEEREMAPEGDKGWRKREGKGGLG